MIDLIRGKIKGLGELQAHKNMWYEAPMYHKMCNCKEIQKHRNAIGTSKKDIGEFKAGKFKVMTCGDIFYTEGKGVYISFGIADPNSVWLPRQEDLQEMVAVKDSTYANIEPFFNFAITQAIRSRPPQFRSMEQLWLAFVMKQKYNKVWNGDNWE